LELREKMQLRHLTIHHIDFHLILHFRYDASPSLFPMPELPLDAWMLSMEDAIWGPECC